MRRLDFENKIKHLKSKIGMWEVVLDKLSLGDFILGCYYDETKRLWKVYINNERGRHRVRLETSSEEEALDKLYSMISFEVESNGSLEV